MYLKDDIAYRLADDLDSALFLKFRNLNLHTGTSSTAINNTAIQEALRIANSQSIEMDQVAWWFHHNAFYGELLRKEQFYAANVYGKPVISGGGLQPIVNLYGIPVYISNNVPVGAGVGVDYPSSSHINALAHKRAIVYAIGNIDGMGVGPRLATERVANAKAFRVIGDLAYGIKELDKDAGVKIISDT
jgi:hypothetical protein